MSVKPLILVSALALALTAVGCGGSKSAPAAVDTSVINPGQQMVNPAGWYKDAVIYQVWVKAFNDGAGGDGIGDLPGVLAKLDYIQGLGVNTIWLSPIFECAYKGSDMHGYDTTDYYAINNEFGGNGDLANLINAVHGKGMRILFDFVPNHTSSANAWFNDSSKQDWYVWQPSIPSGWAYPWGGGSSANVWCSGNSGYYYAPFGSAMPDLNYYNAAVRTEMENVERYWLDRGFDGLRMDAARYLCETGPGQGADQPDTHTQLQAFRAVIDEYAVGTNHPHPNNDATQISTKMMMAEAWTPDATGIAPYYGTGSNEFNMCLDFSAPWAIYNTINSADATQVTGLWDYEAAHYPAGYQSATFDSNHDDCISRPGSQYLGNKNQIVLAEALNILSPGTPIIYYGNEVGMTGVDTQDINLRQPMDWAAVTTQTAQPDSILSWCKYIIQARSTYPALRGGYATLGTDVGTRKALAYVRTAASGERVLVVANLTATPQTVAVTNLTSQGVTAGATVSAILGTSGSGAWNGTSFTVTGLPAYGIRVFYAAGTAFNGNIHGDIQ